TPEGLTRARPSAPPDASRSKNGALVVLPVAVAQWALEQLAGRRPRQLGLEADRTRAFVVGEVLAAKGDQLRRDFGAAFESWRQLHDRLDLLAHFLVGHAEDSSVGDLRMGDQQVLAF